jgi:hypothetical protein
MLIEPEDYTEGLKEHEAIRESRRQKQTLAVSVGQCELGRYRFRILAAMGLIKYE